jgi:probable rRNA maturation factor
MILRAAKLTRLPIEHDLIINIAFVNDRAMAVINEDFVGHEGTTDVITFCYLEGDEPLFDDDIAVDLFICVDFSEREGAKRKNSSYARELVLYIVHGLLHNLGFDDMAEEDAVKMHQMEDEILIKYPLNIILNIQFLTSMIKIIMYIID